jgi:hypothetical protein
MLIGQYVFQRKNKALFLGNGFSGWGVSNLFGISIKQLLDPTHPIHQRFIKDDTISVQMDVLCSLKTCANYYEWHK